MIIVIKQWLNYLVLWSKNTEVKTIILPIRKRNVGTSRNIKKDNPIPKIGNKE